MESVSLILWIVRTILILAVILAAFWVVRWMKGGQSKVLLTVSMKRQALVFLTVLATTGALSILIPMTSLEPETASPVIGLISAAWIMLSAWALTLISSALTGLVQSKYDIKSADNLGARQVHTQVRVLQRIIIVLIWLGAVAAILMQFERFRMLGGTLLASAGILSVLLGLSAQKTFGAILAGIQIALSHPINLDDVVIVEGEWGRIEEITFTYVVVKIWDMRRMVVPINYFTETPFQNWTKKSSEMLGSVQLHVDYSTPLAPLREELKRLCQSSGVLWNEKTCLLQVTDAGTESMTIRALMSSPDAPSAWDLRCLVREGLIGFLKLNYPECLPKHRVLVQEEKIKEIR
ncbi:MAG: mechanosensitive ion channel [Pseudodesulfovibrio sp.]|nr:mechanosensitive ion channel [Pseudodesulfovibrio sp.]